MYKCFVCCIGAEKIWDEAGEQAKRANADAAAQIPTEPATTASASAAGTDSVSESAACVSIKASAQAAMDGVPSLATKGITAGASATAFAEKASDVEGASDAEVASDAEEAMDTEEAMDAGAASSAISSVAVTEVQDPDLQSNGGTTVAGDSNPQEQGKSNFAV